MQWGRMQLLQNTADVVILPHIYNPPIFNPFIDSHIFSAAFCLFLKKSIYFSPPL
jgi:hypothetical protein